MPNQDKIRRVQFYSVNDGAIGHELRKVENVLNTIDSSADFNINDLIELFHVKKYFDNKLTLLSWSDSQISDYQKVIQQLQPKVQNYWLSLNDECLIQEFSILDYAYTKSFWELFQYYKTYLRISGQVISDLLTQSPHQIRNLLSFKDLVNHFGKEIRTHLLNEATSAELLVSQFEHEGRACYIFPTLLNTADKEQIVINYVESKDPNLNYLRLINNTKDVELRLTAKTRLRVKKKTEEINNNLLDSSNSWKIGVEIILSNEQSAPASITRKNGTLRASYSRAYLNSLSNDVELFETFFNLFAYVDQFGLITLTSKQSETDDFENIFMRSKNSYFTSMNFQQKRMLSLGQLMLLKEYLESNKNSLEQIITSYVTHLKDSFGLNSLQFKIRPAKDNYLEGIRLLLPELEFLLKQYQCYVEEGEINFELIRMNSNPLWFSDIKSLLGNKYLYDNNHSLKRLKHIFFSSQSTLNYVESIKEQYSTLFELFSKEKVQLKQFANYQQEEINRLIQDGYLSIDEEGYVTIKNWIPIMLCGQLHTQETISYWHMPDFIRNRIDDMLLDKVLRVENILFSRSEISYLNFYLNKKEFVNGADLRNKYAHGTNPDSPEANRNDYYTLLIITILIIQKISDELTIHRILNTPEQQPADS